ncbi:hypothetical protein ACFL1E_03570 [Candidatus Omnitrophota bacterium]
MNYPKWIKPFFIVSGLYDGILGLLFLFVPFQLFRLANITPPNHIGYVQFSACLLIVFAMMFFRIASDPLANRNLIEFGILLKVSYCAVVFTHWILQTIPLLWVTFAFFDVAFLALFILAQRALKKA